MVPNERSRRPLGWVLALYAATGLAWAWLNPVFEAPDEPFHVAYVNLLLRERRLPSTADARAAEAFLAAHTDPSRQHEVFEAGQWRIQLQWSQPPLYYLLQALPLSAIYPEGTPGALMSARTRWQADWAGGIFLHDPQEAFRWSRPLAAVRAMRLVSVLLGGAVLWATARLAMLVSPKEAALPVLAAGLYGFIPQFTFMAGAVNNDILAYLASTAALWVMVRAGQRRWSAPRSAAALGAALGIAWLCKNSLLYLGPLALCVSLLGQRRWRARLGCAAGAVALGSALMLAGSATRLAPLTDLLRFVFADTDSTWFTFDTPFLGESARATVSYAGHVMGMLAESVWGQFGWSQVPIDQTALAIYWVLAACGALGWWWRNPDGVAPAVDRRALAILLMGVGWFAVSLGMLYQRVFIPQGGRYLLTVGAPLAILLGLGMLRLRGLLGAALERRVPAPQFAWAVLAGLVGLNWFVLGRSIWIPYRAAWSG